jgi:transglutaminase-like putative cysteine protease
MLLKLLFNTPNHLRSLIQRAFSPQIEDSIRLRALGMASLWLAAIALVWAGAGPWLTLGSALLGATGYWTSWYRRSQRSRLWPLLIASAITAAAFMMRSQVLEAFTGNWLPLGQFLVLVQALASFDVRTRGGLYTGLVLSGIVLFFVSQQAFQESFGVFVIGYVVLLLAFLSVSFLEDGVRAARVYWRKHQTSTVAFWVGAACAVFALSGLVFWVMPRGETSLGVPQVAILPFSTSSLDRNAQVPDIDPSTIPVSLERPGSEVVPSVMPDLSHSSPGLEDEGDVLTQPGLSPGLMTGDAFLGYAGGAAQDQEVVFFVRSKVASYWKGRTLDTFDGRYWRDSNTPSDIARSRSSAHLLVNQESFGLDNRLRYAQTFFIQQDAPNSLFTGYRGIRIVSEEGSPLGAGVHAGDSYRVLSAHPRHSVESLRRSQVGWVGSRYLALPPESGRLRALVGEITQGATSDFAKVEHIMGYLALHGNYDHRRPGDLTSSASLDQFLFESKSGSALDYATATVMLARASGLPSRLALGYLPGARDPLSGAYMVREKDAHAWAEVYFEDRGWVPIDSAPRPDITLLSNTGPGVGYLFQGGFGEKAYQAVKATPVQAAQTIPDLMDHQGLWTAGGVLFFVVSVALGWRRFRSRSQRCSPDHRWLVYSPLFGDERRQVLKLYRRAEKLLRQKGSVQRLPWQTMGEYTRVAAGNEEARNQLAWFTAAAQQAAYNPDQLPPGLAAEAQQRLARLKTAMKTSQRIES